MALVEAAAAFARDVLAPGGAFLAKVIQAVPSIICSRSSAGFRDRQARETTGEPADSAELYSSRRAFGDQADPCWTGRRRRQLPSRLTQTSSFDRHACLNEAETLAICIRKRRRFSKRRA